MMPVTMMPFENGKSELCEIDLNVLQNRMKKIRFYGSTTILWQNGDIVVIKMERMIKPSDFNEVLVQLNGY